MKSNLDIAHECGAAYVRPYHFHRFVNGQERAEDVTVEHAATLQDAMKIAAHTCPARQLTVLVHAPAAQAQDAWQTIETAPKDGTEILLRSARGRIADGLWSAASERSGFWAWAYVNQEPAEWMPLPLAQAKEDAQDDKAFVERGMRRIRDAEDAQRYRLLRRGQRWSVIDGAGNTLRAEVLDAAVDAAITAQQGGAA